MGKNPKEKQLLTVAETLFAKYGVKRISVEEICKTAEVSKMTFYKYFPNKIELAKRIIRDMTSASEDKFFEIMNMNISFPEKVHRFVQMKLDANERLGQEFYNDLIGAVPELYKFLQEIGRESYKRTLTVFKKAQDRGEIRADIPLDFILYSLNSIMSKISDPQLTEIFEDRKQMIEIMVENFFFGIVSLPEDR